MKTKIIFSSCSNSSNNPRIKTDDALYWYINKDGARITKINYKFCFGDDPSKITREEIDYVVFKIIASYHHGISYKELNDNISEYIADYCRIN